MGLLLVARTAGAQQQGEGYSQAGDAAAQSRALQEQSQPYTIKSGDFRLLATPSLGVDWNDNINLASSGALQDFIVKPNLQLTATYPLTAHNVLRLNVGVGYDCYLDHSDYSGFRLTSDSQVNLDVYVKDFWFNFHDRFSYTQDSAGTSAVAGSGKSGGFDNTAGLTTTWDLKDMVLTLGYDHENFFASDTSFEYTDRATEIVPVRAGFRLHPQLTAGLEGSAAFTAYDQPVLNNNVGYNMGVYADWRPGHYFSVLARGGYTIYNFEQTSQVIRAIDQNSWYVGLTISHQITDAISYSLSAGHELKLGTQADSQEYTYVRPGVTWSFMKDLSVNFTLSYENGTQGTAGSVGGVDESYDYFGGGLGFTYDLTKKLRLGLTYRLTIRGSDAQSRDYTQNVIGLNVAYTPK